MGSRSDNFRALVSRDPGNELFRFSLAQALAAEGKNEEAIEQYRACAAKKPDWMMPRILLGKLLLQAGKSTEARPVLEEALRLAVDQRHEDPERELRAVLGSL